MTAYSHRVCYNIIYTREASKSKTTPNILQIPHTRPVEKRTYLRGLGFSTLLRISTLLSEYDLIAKHPISILSSNIQFII